MISWFLNICCVSISWLHHRSPGSALLFTIWVTFAWKNCRVTALNFFCYFLYCFLSFWCQFCCTDAMLWVWLRRKSLSSALLFTISTNWREKKIAGHEKSLKDWHVAKTFLADNTCADGNYCWQQVSVVVFWQPFLSFVGIQTEQMD